MTGRGGSSIPKLKQEIADLEETLEAVIWQACGDHGGVDSMAITAYADGIRELAKRGKLRIESEYGRRIIAVQPTAPVKESAAATDTEPRRRPVVYLNVNEEGEVYGRHASLDAALAEQAEFPNDTVQVQVV